MATDIPFCRFSGFLALTLFSLNAGCGGSSSKTNTGLAPVPTPTEPQSFTNVLTFHNDVARTGQNLTEKILTHAVVNSSSFGKLFSVPVDGKVDAQPLYVSELLLADQLRHSVVFAATENDSVYAFDAKTGAVYWHVTLLLLGEMPSDDRGCGQVTPEIGITATPVIDLTAGPHGTIYLLAMSKDAADHYHHRLHALDITTGQEEFNGPIEISASYPGVGDNSSNGEVTFDAKQYKSRPGMLLLNGVVYTGWGSHCDFRPYTGWLIGYDRLTLKQAAVFNFAPNGSEAALWNSGAGITADVSTGEIFVAVSNGTFDTTLNANGFPNQGDFGNAFVRLNVVNGRLNAQDYWTMSNTVTESAQDEDLGSGGVLLLPDLTNPSGETVKLGTGAGKDGKLYVFNRANMGKFNSQNNSALYQELPAALGGTVFSTPAWFNGTVYYGAVGDRIRAFTVKNALLSTQPASTTDNFFEYPGTTPAVSANGTSDPILWAVENANPAVLHAYDATNLAHELYNSNQASSGRDQFGPGNKFIVPTIADGRVFVGTTNSVAVFGRMP
jgi:outer membrane protein assembly factor BamB